MFQYIKSLFSGVSEAADIAASSISGSQAGQKRPVRPKAHTAASTRKKGPKNLSRPALRSMHLTDGTLKPKFSADPIGFFPDLQQRLAEQRQRRGN